MFHTGSYPLFILFQMPLLPCMPSFNFASAQVIPCAYKLWPSTLTFSLIYKKKKKVSLNIIGPLYICKKSNSSQNTFFYFGLESVLSRSDLTLF